MAVEMVSPSATSLLALGRVGKRVRDKWRLVRLLGQGGAGAVYEAVHRNGFRAAIKLMHASQVGDASSQRRFVREARTTNRLHHRGVLRYYDEDVDDDGTPFLVMELLEGETCEERLRRVGPLPSLVALRVADQVLAVLEVAHKRGVLHRDIKPSNVFLTSQNEVKLLDFGLARVVRAPGEERRSETFLTRFVVGTPAYMAPEQLRGQTFAVNERTDLWAVGALLFVLLTNQWPVDFDLVKLSRSGDRELPSFGKLRPSAPPALVALVDTALHVDASQRWRDARAMRHALREAQRQCRLASVEAKQPRSLTWLRGGLVAVAAAMLGAGVALAVDHVRSKPGSRASVPDEVTLTVRVTPPEARVWLDGQPLPSNPFSQHLARSDEEHELRAEATGYRPMIKLVTPRRDLEVELHLEPLSLKTP